MYCLLLLAKQNHVFRSITIVNVRALAGMQASLNMSLSLYASKSLRHEISQPAKTTSAPTGHRTATAKHAPGAQTEGGHAKRWRLLFKLPCSERLA